MVINIDVYLSEHLLESIRNCPDVIFREECEIPIIELINSDTGTDCFLKFLQDEHDMEVNPVLTPNFGHPLYPYIPPNIQVEVFNLLATYQKLVASNPYFIIAKLPFIGGGIQYHNSKMAIHAVYKEISGLHIFTDNCPGIASISSGQIICDLNINFSNAMIVLRIRKV